jgi:nitroreductase
LRRFRQEINLLFLGSFTVLNARISYLCVSSFKSCVYMNNFSELITNRRSMRKFTGEKLSLEDVVSIMKAALISPTSKRSNSWQFIVVDDKETLQKLSRCKEHSAAFLADAALAIVVTADPLASDIWIEDAAVASIMIQLQAEDLGLGSCWVQVRERFHVSGIPAGEYVHEVLDIPLQLQVLSLIAIGHKGMERKPFDEKHLQWEKIHINKYGGK